VLDTETTGLKSDYHEIIQYAALLCDNNLNVIDSKVAKIKPRWVERASKKALEINGYHPRTWNPEYDSHERAVIELNNFIEEHTGPDDEVVLIGQNVMFDIKFMRQEYKRYKIRYPFEYDCVDLIDVVKIWEKTNNKKLKNRKLAYLSEFTGCKNECAHDAYYDVLTTLDILKWFINDLKHIKNKSGVLNVSKR